MIGGRPPYNESVGTVDVSGGSAIWKRQWRCGAYLGLRGSEGVGFNARLACCRRRHLKNRRQCREVVKEGGKAPTDPH